MCSIVYRLKCLNHVYNEFHTFVWYVMCELYPLCVSVSLRFSFQFIKLQ